LLENKVDDIANLPLYSLFFPNFHSN